MIKLIQYNTTTYLKILQLLLENIPSDISNIIVISLYLMVISSSNIYDYFSEEIATVVLRENIK